MGLGLNVTIGPWRTCIGIACMLLCASWPALAARGAGDDAVAVYDLRSGLLDDCLKAFAGQSGLQLLYSPSIVEGKRSAGLRGRYTRDQALARLLAEHRLTAVWVNPNTLLLQAVRETPRRARARPIPVPKPAGAAVAPGLTELDPVDVVGTRIPRTSLETVTPITVITSEDIEASGYATLFELLRVQPGMFGHHPSAVSSEGGASYQPIVTPAATSLYSLGPRATLFLVDGRPVAKHGLVSSELGGLFDLNGIPLGFIDHIEILRGGASAIYGADAIAGTVNIVLKKGDLGTQLGARFGQSERGDAQLRGASASTGFATRSGGEGFVAVDAVSREALEGDRRRWHTADLSRFGLGDAREPIGYRPQFDGLDRAATQPLPPCLREGGNPDSPFCRYDAAKYRTLQPKLTARSMYANWRQPIADAFVLNASARIGRTEQTLLFPPMTAFMPLPDDHPDASPTGLLFYSFADVGPLRNLTRNDTRDLAVDGVLRMRGDWTWSFDLSHSRNRTRSEVSNVLQLSKLGEVLYRYRFDGSPNPPDVLDALSATIRPSGAHSIARFETHVEGTLLKLPAADVQAVAGLELHRENLAVRPDPLQVENDLSLAATDIAPYNLYAHGAALFAELAVSAGDAFKLELAGRADRRNGYGTRWSPKIGLKWMPADKIMLRASGGGGYRPPSPYDFRNPLKFSANNLAYVPAEPPYSPCHEIIEGLCMAEYGSGVNKNLRPEYSRSSNFGVVWAPSDPFNLSLDRFRIERQNEFAVVDPSFDPAFIDGLRRDANGVLYRIDLYIGNATRSKIDGWELEANYLRPVGAGHFAVRAGAMYLDRHLLWPGPQAQPRDIAGYQAPKLSAGATLEWRFESSKTALTLRHFGRSHAYAAGEGCPEPNAAVGKCENPSVTLAGLSYVYTGVPNWTFSLNINNLADRKPANYRAGQDGYNIAVDDPYGRYYAFGATYRF